MRSVESFPLIGERPNRSAAQRVHEALAAVYFLLLPLTEAPKDIAFALLVAWSSARLWWTWRHYLMLRIDLLVWLGSAWAAWTALSMMWSTEPAQGFDELGAMRALATPLLIWPVRDALPRFTGAALMGVAAANVVQLLQQLHLLGLKPNADGRLDGLMHAIKTGAWCAAAIGWHLAYTLLGSKAIRKLALTGLFMAAIGLVATGSRGPWIAAAVMAPLGLLSSAWRQPRVRRRAVLLAAAVLLVGASLWPTLGDRVLSRIESAWKETRQARDDRAFATSAGLRLGQWTWAWAIFLEHPLAGAGAGGFAAAQDELPSFQEALHARPDNEGYIRRDHPHSTYLHTLACGGVVGGAILAALLAGIVQRLWTASKGGDPLETGSLLVLIAWIVGAAFDCYNLNGHHMGMLGLVLAVAVHARGRHRAASHDPRSSRSPVA
jgi:O-antigen ligase